MHILHLIRDLEGVGKFCDIFIAYKLLNLLML